MTTQKSFLQTAMMAGTKFTDSELTVLEGAICRDLIMSADNYDEGDEVLQQKVDTVVEALFDWTDLDLVMKAFSKQLLTIEEDYKKDAHNTDLEQVLKQDAQMLLAIRTLIDIFLTSYK